jgi:hypothetical protein
VDVRSASPIPIPVQRPRPQPSAVLYRLALLPPLLGLKLKVATLARTSHHPKIVARIKTPYPISDMLTGLPPSAGDRGILVLTGEEIKDVVSCTGLWVFVREGTAAWRRSESGWVVHSWVMLGIIDILRVEVVLSFPVSVLWCTGTDGLLLRSIMTI